MNYRNYKTLEDENTLMIQQQIMNDHREKEPGEQSTFFNIALGFVIGVATTAILIRH